ncbi:hypothetical protein Tco_0943254 [Tanacetum coccineum]
MNIDEAIQVSFIIDKLPPSWKDFKHTLKHKKEELTLVELGSHLHIEESLRAQDSDKPKGNNVVGLQKNTSIWQETRELDNNIKINKALEFSDVINGCFDERIIYMKLSTYELELL